MSVVVESDARMVSGTFSSAAGRRDYLLFVPEGDLALRGLVVMLHGCKQTPADFAAGTRMNAQAAAEGYAVLWPGQSRGDNPYGCWNWFRPDHQKRGFGEPAIIADLTREILADHDIPRSQVFCAGFSAGAAMALVLRETYPDVYAAVAAHSGVAPGVAANGVAALSAMKGDGISALPRPDTAVPALVVHGADDATVDLANVHQIAAPLETRIIPGIGHGWSGGAPEGSFTAPSGPDITREILDFFLASTNARQTPLLTRLAQRAGLI